MNKARKGEVIALQSTHTSTDSKFRVSTYQTWILATVKRANVNGIVMEAVPAGQTVARKVDGHRKVYTITGPHRDKFGATFYRDDADGQTWAGGTWEDLCQEFDIEPYDREVYEHWIVSDWFARRLAEKGEKVDTDFAGLTVWARTCTGQSISLDGVVQDIAVEANSA